jgi:exportin-5
MQHVMQRILTDRFWQAGISTESMEDFYARVNSSKSSYEGFASTIRGALRQVREKSYSILCYLARLNEKFYGLPGLPDVIANAVYGTVQSLSSHQTTVLVNMSSQLIGRCPVELRSSFLPPVLIALFEQLDGKLNSEWGAVIHRASQANEGDNLGDEMKSESILRLLTFNAVSIANSLLDIDSTLSRDDPILDNRMHKMILVTPQVLGQILIFLTSALRFRDTRSCNTAIQIFGRTIPFFNKPSEVQSYICDSVLKAAITSFNEPYFVDAQKNLASLIAQIISMDSEGGVPRSVLLSLPGLSEEKVDKVVKRVRGSKSAQQGGSAVLGLLSGLRGVSIHELGKMEVSKPVKREFTLGMDVVDEGGNRIRRGGEEELEGVKGMFGG